MPGPFVVKFPDNIIQSQARQGQSKETAVEWEYNVGEQE